MTRQLGVSVGEYVAQNISGPADLELWYGLPDDQADRVVPT